VTCRVTGLALLVFPLAFGFSFFPADRFPTLSARPPQDAGTGALPDMSPREFLRAIRDLDPDMVRSATFQELVLTRDAGRMVFSDGSVSLIEIGGIVVGAVLVGQGTFEMTPPDPVERWQMGRFFDGPAARVELNSAFLLFADSTVEELSRILEFQGAPPRSQFRDVVEEGAKYVTHNSQTGIQAVRTFLNGEGSDFFHAHLTPRRGDPYFFRLSSFDPEEVTFGRKADGRGDNYEVLSSFHLAEEYPDPSPIQEPEWGAHILHYEIEGWIARGADFSARTTAYLTAELAEGNWVDLPTYRWASTGEAVEGGYKLTLRVRQEDVPETFRMLVPVTVDFWGEGAATVRILVQGPETVVELPLLPREPDEIRFNDFESVLARVRAERW